MKSTNLSRRGFLAGGGLGVVGLAGGVPAEDTQESPDPGESQSEGPTRGVLITSAESPLAGAIAAELSRGYRVSLTAREDVRSDYPVTKSELNADEATVALVRGNEAIVHVAQPVVAADETVPIDDRTRLTYNLLQAAKQAGVQRLVYLSSLELLTAYGEEFEVTEEWRPRPGSEPRLLSHYLGEFTCREFAREGSLSVVILRLGKVVRAEEAAGQPFDPLWVDQRDVVQAVWLALAALETDDGRKLGPWSIFHVQPDSPAARFSVEKAKRLLGYKPKFNG
ncbi:MAG: hypothetical protein A2V98_06670 [Planctomycetes bacterium RBG_16_64_12]|nr:MAG: hypothetical protein A2V98_06670 [Planctomycetes bacterium RBG_16_64_12]